MSTPRRTIYVSSRKSQLAMVQTNEVIAMLQVRMLSISSRLPRFPTSGGGGAGGGPHAGRVSDAGCCQQEHYPEIDFVVGQQDTVGDQVGTRHGPFVPMTRVL